MRTARSTTEDVTKATRCQHRCGEGVWWTGLNRSPVVATACHWRGMDPYTDRSWRPCTWRVFFMVYIYVMVTWDPTPGSCSFAEQWNFFVCVCVHPLADQTVLDFNQYCYRPQCGCDKVMFSQVSVISFMGWVFDRHPLARQPLGRHHLWPDTTPPTPGETPSLGRHHPG